MTERRCSRDNADQRVERVETRDGTSTWTIQGPPGTSVTVKTASISDRPDAEIAWRSVEGSDIDTEGKVMFREAPAGRGTEVEAVRLVPARLKDGGAAKTGAA